MVVVVALEVVLVVVVVVPFLVVPAECLPFAEI